MFRPRAQSGRYLLRAIQLSSLRGFGGGGVKKARRERGGNHFSENILTLSSGTARLSESAPAKHCTCVAHDPCYTGFVAKSKQNLTLVVDEDLLLAARKVALDRRTSVNQLVREFLAGLVDESSQRDLARERLKKAMDKGLIEIGERNWTRDDLYERR